MVGLGRNSATVWSLKVPCHVLRRRALNLSPVHTHVSCFWKMFSILPTPLPLGLPNGLFTCLSRIFKHISYLCRACCVHRHILLGSVALIIWIVCDKYHKTWRDALCSFSPVPCCFLSVTFHTRLVFTVGACWVSAEYPGWRITRFRLSDTAHTLNVYSFDGPQDVFHFNSCRRFDIKFVEVATRNG